MKSKIRIGSGIIVENNEGELLLGKRINAFGEGNYGVPGGRQEDGEDAMTCASRELKDETGLIAQKLVLLGRVIDTDGFVHSIFHCTKYTGEPKNIETDKCEEWEWFKKNALPENILVAHKAGVEMLENEGISEIVLENNPLKK